MLRHSGVKLGAPPLEISLAHAEFEDRRKPSHSCSSFFARHPDKGARPAARRAPSVGRGRRCPALPADPPDLRRPEAGRPPTSNGQKRRAAEATLSMCRGPSSGSPQSTTLWGLSHRLLLELLRHLFLVGSAASSASPQPLCRPGRQCPALPPSAADLRQPASWPLPNIEEMVKGPPQRDGPSLFLKPAESTTFRRSPYPISSCSSFFAISSIFSGGLPG